MNNTVVPQLDLPDNAHALHGSMQDGVQLPFSVCYFYAHNGSKQFQSVGGLPYHGGWAVDVAEADNYLLSRPDELVKYQLNNRQGDTYEVYGAPKLLIAPIAKRKRWITTDYGNSRSHVQVLALVGMLTKNGVINMGAHVLSAKGWQSKNLEDALREWDSITAAARRSWPGALSNYFWHAVGVDAKNPRWDSVGSNHTSTITPVRLQEAEDKTPEALARRYVGAELAAQMVELLEQAQEWLREWDRRSDTEISSASDPTPDMDTLPPIEDEFPF